MLYIFDKTEKLVAILNNDGNACPYWDAIHEEKLNGENTFSFSVPVDHNDSQYVVEGNLVAFRDLDQNWQMFEIRRLFDQHGDDLTKTAYCEHVYYELIDDILTDVRPYNVSASFALEQALQNSRWEVGTVDDLGINSTHFYYESALSAVQKVANTWGGELQYRISVTGGTISNRYVDLIARRGKITGKQFEYTKDIKEIKREVDTTNIITACYGRGKGEEVGSTENGATYGRRITFANVEWSTANGDPADKPLGQEWVGDDEALAQWGRNGRHRFGIYLDDEETDPATLLQKTWDYLQENKTPKVTYQLSVLDLERLSGYKHEAVRLGDTVNIIDRAFDPALKISARVIEIKRNLLLPEDTEIVLGNFAPTLSDTLAQQQRVISNVRDRQGVWDRATQFNPDGTLDTSWLNGVINTLQNELLGGGGTVKITDNDGILILDNATTPTKALMLKGGIFGIANSKDANGNWIWRTFGTGDGFTADLINAGQIQTSLVKILGNANFYWDSDNIYIINPANTNQQIRLGKYDGTNLGIAFTEDGGTNWTQAITFTGVNASSVTVGTMLADRIKGGTLTLGGSGNVAGVLSIKNASGTEVVRGDNNGLTVNSGSYYINDAGMNTTLVQKPNIIPDHSFECLTPSGSADATYYDYFDFTAVTEDWDMAGFPRLLSARHRNVDPEAAFGLQCVATDASNFVQTYVIVKPSTTYYVSGFTAKGYRPAGTGYPRIFVQYYDSANTSLGMKGYNFTANATAFSWKRVGFAFTTPANTDYIRIVFQSSAAGSWYYWDGVQLVEGSAPTRYDPEENLWRYIRGYTGLGCPEKWYGIYNKYVSANVALSAATLTVVPYGGSASEGTFTALADGLYFVQGNVGITGVAANAYWGVVLYRNGSAFRRLHYNNIYTTISASDRTSFALAVRLNGRDYIDIRVWCSQSAQIVGDSAGIETRLEVYWI